MHVAAAVHDGDRIIGVVTVAKPSRTLAPIIARSERTVLRHGLLLLGATLLIGGAFTAWLTISMSRLVRYARLLAAGRPAEPPSRGNDEIGELSRALAQLRNEVGGRAYVEHYVQHLTHEMKSPLAAIRGAAELLGEADLPAAERSRFITNVQTQSERLQTLIDKLLCLAQLEHQCELEAPQMLSVQELFADIEQAMSAQDSRHSLNLCFAADPAAQICGDRFLLSLALTNLIQNALDFSPKGGTVACTASTDETTGYIAVRDQGPGIAEFASQRIFERFFSLPRPDGTPKSTGLGLPLVHEIAMLHGGDIKLKNAEDGGTLALLNIPLPAEGKRTAT
jgi:two-component system sensor histidine kinase CreC